MSRETLRHIVLPLLFLTTALFGGLRFVGAENEMRFIPPSLMTLLLSACLMVLLARARLLDLQSDWLGEERSPLENGSNALTLVTLYAATVQVFNCVLPEDTLFNAAFIFFFVLLFWNNLFVLLQPQRFLKGLGGLLLGAFVVKYVLLVGLFEPSESISKTILQSLLRGVTLGGIETEAYTRATGYTAFAAIVLYLVGLWGSSPPKDESRDLLFEILSARRLTPAEERRVLAALAPLALAPMPAPSPPHPPDEAIDAEIDEEPV